MLALWFLLIGTLLIAMAVTSRLVQRLPVSSAIVYLAIGMAIGPWGAELLVVDAWTQARVIEVLAEVTVLISLFAVGLKIEVAFSRAAWDVPLRLATIGMVVTIALIALAAHTVLALPWPLALMLGAVLAPTDPVLASDVQVRQPGDRDRLRFSLTTEGALNDGTAFPGVMLALVLLGEREGGPWLSTWVLRDLIWATVAGLAVGTACGVAVARAIARMKRSGPLQFEEFLVLGVIALSYGIALLVQSYGFLAVFAAGAAVAHSERDARRRQERAAGAAAPDSSSADRRDTPAEDARARHEAQAASDPADIPLTAGVAGDTARAKPPERDEPVVAPRLLALAEQFERLAEVVLVLLVGALLAQVTWSAALLVFVALVLLLVRPLMVLLVVRARSTSASQRRLLGWFGIRGIGSIYYLAFALNHGVPAVAAGWLLDAVVATIAASIVAHGVSATPLMRRYHRQRQ